MRNYLMVSNVRYCNVKGLKVKPHKLYILKESTVQSQ